MLKGFFLLALLALGGAAFADLKLSDSGAFEFEGIPMRLICFDKNWKAAVLGSQAVSVKSKTGNEVSAQIDMPDLKGSLRQNIVSCGENSWRYTAEVQLSPGYQARQIALDMTNPASLFEGAEAVAGGKKLIFPRSVLKIKDPFNLLWKQSSLVELFIKQTKVSFRSDTPFVFLVQDDRAFNGNTFAVRLLLNKISDDRYQIALNLKATPCGTVPVDLRSACTAGFVDEIAGDQKGGWTDQGKKQDLRALPFAENKPLPGDIPFVLVSPAANNGKSCIVLKGPSRGYFPEQAEIVLTKPVQGTCFYCLHAIAWPSAGKIGEIIFDFADGEKQIVAVEGQKDVGDWYAPQPVPNGVIAWRGEAEQAAVGLYRTGYNVKEKPIRKITFKSTGRSVWGIVAATMSSAPVPEKSSESPVFIQEGENWKPIRLEKNILSGSVLDFSGNLDAPAGKYGPVVARNGHFEFRDRPGQAVRFYGTNLVDSLHYMDHENSELLADEIAKAGFNLVRIHHHDGRLSLRENGNSTKLDPASLDRLNYLISCFKKRGIYLITDCYVSRTFTPEEEAEWGAKFWAFKYLVFLKKSAMENWKSFARNWFTAPNPYTGIPLKEEPSLIGVNLINEGYAGIPWSGPIGDMYQTKFRQYLEENGLKEDPGRLDEMRSRWILQLYDAGFQEMHDFLRKDLGMTVPISDQNQNAQWLLTFPRDKYDYIDNHFYYDHPAFPVNSWRLPILIKNESSLKHAGGDLSWMFPTRIWGKPMAITEFDYSKPNFYRAEGGILPAAYAGLQDWAALVQFAYSHGSGPFLDPQPVGGNFDLTTDVVKALSHRIGIKLFLENEIKPAPVKLSAVLTFSAGMNFDSCPVVPLRNLGLIARLGTAVIPDGVKSDKLPGDIAALINVGCNFPKDTAGIPVVRADKHQSDPIGELIAKGVLPQTVRDASGKSFRSVGGQLEMDTAKECFRATAPGVEVLILPEKERGKSGIMEISNQTGRGVFSIQSVDHHPLNESKRLLFLHLTDSQASMLKFDDSHMTRFSTWGTAPHLAANGKAQVELMLPGSYVLYSCDTAGKRLAEIPLNDNGTGKISFEAKVFRPEGQVFVYELVRKK